MNWNTNYQNSPEGGNSWGIIDDEIRALKHGLRERFLKLFNFPLDDQDMQMVPKPGIAMAFIQTDPPTQRPDGTLFTEEDEGRIWIKNKYSGSPSSTRPIGKYFLQWDSVGDTYNWIKDPSMSHLGALEMTTTSFTNPSGSDPYNSGTRPGWVIADGSSVISGLPNPLGWTNSPNVLDKYLKAEATPNVSGGRETFTLTASNVPRHKHGISADALNITIEGTKVTVKVPHSRTGSANPSGFDIRKNPDVEGYFDASEEDKHIHEATHAAGNTENWGESSPTAIDLNPTYYSVIPIVRMY